ncbi:MAG: hypothetical protein LBH14_07060 [Desulfobulbaceae bacterium]|jgi:hypothetical protein|nr:hypothetical protein [Desulfobulbaceae bacterium]
MPEEKNNNAEQRAALEHLLEKSRGTDIPVLLQAKETAKRFVREDPSSANVAALSRVTAMLEKAEKAMNETESPEVLKTTGAVLRYLQEEAGRQIQKTKLYDDIKRGLLRKENRAFRRVDVERYAASLPKSTTPDGRVAAAEERLRRAEEADIRIKEARAVREEKKNAILDGQYVPRADVDQELAARAVTLNTGIKSMVEAQALDIVVKVGGEAKQAMTLVRELETLIDAACSEYARRLEFEVTLTGIDDEATDKEEEA